MIAFCPEDPLRNGPKFQKRIPMGDRLNATAAKISRVHSEFSLSRSRRDRDYHESKRLCAVGRNALVGSVSKTGLQHTQICRKQRDFFILLAVASARRLDDECPRCSADCRQYGRAFSLETKSGDGGALCRPKQYAVIRTNRKREIPAGGAAILPIRRSASPAPSAEERNWDRHRVSCRVTIRPALQRLS